MPVGHGGSPRIVPELLMLPCEELPMAKDGRLSSLLQNHVEVVQHYYLCSDRHRALAGWLRMQQVLPEASNRLEDRALAGQVDVHE